MREGEGSSQKVSNEVYVKAQFKLSVILQLNIARTAFVNASWYGSLEAVLRWPRC